MNKLNTLCLKLLNYFENRSILFYIFWLSFLFGEGFYQILLKVKGCTPLLSANKIINHGFDSYQIITCDPIENAFIEGCIYICIFTIIAYFIWYVFKCFRFIYRLGFQR